ncbi:MAG: hypothetical protein A3G87_00925 [Omnitrophica bacterium RIFCSPLOWO2_12_FULL_50_11]|nr:MAG: hypothetical protein A3G87_00925 [Omnitrophica bacterium RIFCSPLOWO2_12_FULL_50_11]
MSKVLSEQILKDLNENMVIEAIHRYVSKPFLEQQIVVSRAKEKRKRKLGSLVMVYWVLYACLFRESNQKEVLKKLMEGYQIRGWRIEAGKLASGPAISKARTRLGWAVMKQSYEALTARTEPCADSFYKGMRLKAYDGSCFNLQDTEELHEVFRKPSTGQGQSAWPQLRLAMEVDVGTHHPIQLAFGGYEESEKTMVKALLKNVHAGELVLLDRGLGFFDDLKSIRTQGGHFLVHAIASGKVKPVKLLKDGSYLGIIRHSQTGEKMLVRVIEYRITNPQRAHPEEIHRLTTSLLDETLHPAEALIELYHERWEIELSFDELKTHLFRRNELEPFFRSKSKTGVLQELYGLLLLYHVIRSFMQEAAAKYDLAPRRLSFTDCVQILRRGVVRMQAMRAEQLAQAYEDLLDEMTSTLLPERRNRINPRVVKKHQRKFPPKQPKYPCFDRLQTTFKEEMVMVRRA